MSYAMLFTAYIVVLELSKPKEWECCLLTAPESTNEALEAISSKL
jgi:hypothetical protein